MLNLGATLALTSAAANLPMGMFHWAIARAHGWRMARKYAAIALAAGLFSALNVVYCIDELPNAVYLGAGRLS